MGAWIEINGPGQWTGPGYKFRGPARWWVEDERILRAARAQNGVTVDDEAPAPEPGAETQIDLSLQPSGGPLTTADLSGNLKVRLSAAEADTEEPVVVTDVGGLMDAIAADEPEPAPAPKKAVAKKAAPKKVKA